MEAGDELSVSWKTTYVKRPFSPRRDNKLLDVAANDTSQSQYWICVCVCYVSQSSIFKQFICNHCDIKLVTAWEEKRVNKLKSIRLQMCWRTFTTLIPPRRLHDPLISVCWHVPSALGSAPKYIQWQTCYIRGLHSITQLIVNQDLDQRPPGWS